MKTYLIMACALATALSMSASATTVVRTTDPVTGVWHATTGVVTGLGNAAVNTWHGVTSTVVRTTTKVVKSPAHTAVRHTTVRYH